MLPTFLIDFKNQQEELGVAVLKGTKREWKDWASGHTLKFRASVRKLMELVGDEFDRLCNPLA